MGDLDKAVVASAMTVELEISINASREEVFSALTKDIGKWWAYKESDEMHMEAWPGGRFYEGHSKGDGFLWGTVLEVRTPRVLRVSELLGSMSSVRSGAHKYELEDHAGSTNLKVSCQVLGEFDDEVRACLQSGWSALLTYLKNWVEKGVACQ